MEQYINFHATQPASEFYNNDKYIRTNFMEAGVQYMFNRDWGQDDSIGDIRIQGMYTGLSEDMKEEAMVSAGDQLA